VLSVFKRLEERARAELFLDQTTIEEQSPITRTSADRFT